MARRIKEIKEINEFEKPAPMSGGNAWENHVQRETVIDKAKAGMGSVDIGTVGASIEKAVEKYITKTTPYWWVLLQEQANYFCNQFQWNITDRLLKSLIVNIIRCAFYNGKAGLYYNDITEKFEAVVLSNLEHNSAGELLSAKYTHAHQYFDGINKDSESYEFNGVNDIPPSKIENLAVFKWGTESLDAWVRIRPYVMRQHMMMEMLTVQTFTYNKKFMYKCNEPSAVPKEIELFFNTKNPFIVSAGFTGDFINRFEEINLSAVGGLEFLEYYKESMSIVYSQLGRRENVDIKKERNVSGEVEASQENFDILFLDVNRQFNIFAETANEILAKYGKDKIEVVLKDVIEPKEEVEDELGSSDQETGLEESNR